MLLAKSKKDRLIVLDSHAILHRAYHALPDFTSSAGEPTGALYGLSSMLLKILSDLSPDYVVAAYDVAEPTYRHEAYEDYKAGRAKTDEELVTQINRSKDVFEAFNIPIYEKAGFEADDIIGTIVEKTKNNKDLEVIIASGDMDTLQLVDGARVRVYTLRKGIKDTIIYDEEKVKERFGFSSDLLPDYKGLRGDPSDNIPGIKGVGEKTATILIASFGGIEETYKALKKDRDSFAKKTGLSERMINLVADNEEEANFSKILAEIRRDVPIEFSLAEKKWLEGLDISNISKLFSELSFRTLAARAKSILSPELPFEDESPEDKIESEVSERQIEEVGLALWLLDSTVSDPKVSDILGYAKTNDFEKAKEKIFADLKKEGLEEVYEKIEKPLIPVVRKMEGRGVAIDKKFLSDLSSAYHKELESLEVLIWKEAGEEFNINSPKQLGEIIYEKLNLNAGYIKKTSTGAKSTRESELLKMTEVHPIINLILEYRELQKLLSTYIDSLPAQVDADGRLRARFLQTGTATGRMSSQSPNLQNIPIKSERGREIRKAFVSSRGFSLLALDYSQIELRVAAMLSRDEKLLEIFKNNRDVHTEVAAQVFDVPPEEVNQKMRAQAKVINFGILYGMGARALAKNLGSSQKDAQKYLAEYFKRFSGLANYMTKIKHDAARVGYTETYFGRKRFFPDMRSRLPYVRAEAERQAMNAPIQGTQADIIKKAMVQIDLRLAKDGLGEDVFLILQVHDELIYEVKETKVKEVAAKIKPIMESILSPEETGGIVFTASALAGPNWGNLKKLEIKNP